MPRSRKVWSVSLLLLTAFCHRLPAQESLSLEARSATVISLNSRVIDTSRPQPAIAEELRVRPEDSIQDEIMLVKFPGPVTARQIKALRAASLRVYTYLPYYSYLVKMPAGQARKSLSAMGASWSGPYHPAYKISPEIAAVEAGEAKAQGQEEYRPVMLQLFPDANLGEVARKLRDLGVKGIVGSGRGSFFSRIRLLLTPTEL